MSQEHANLVRETLAANIARVQRDGPRLSYAIQTVILARDPARKEVLVGGLGACGVGEMWCEESEGDRGRPGYDTCPHVDSTLGFEALERSLERERAVLSNNPNAASL